jgi:hypothetical protein
MKRSVLGLLLAVLLPAAASADLESDLNARYRGGRVIVRVPLYSNCDGYYNDNEVSGKRVNSKARRSFEAGELARVERIGVRRGRIDVFLDLAEGVLAERQDGPFTLYDPLICQVQLQVSLPGRPDLAAAEAALAALLELHDDARAAEASPAWNKRRREPFPEGYEETFAEHQAWKAAQTNAAVQEELEESVEEASRIAERIRSDAEYLEGFAAGVERQRGRSSSDCGTLLDGYFSPDSASGKDSDWRRGYEDGQRLGYHLERARRLNDCFVPVPPPAP